MRFALLGAGAALAGISQAFLIPILTPVDSAQSLEIARIPTERIVEVDCPGCPVKTIEGGVMSWGNAASTLRLNVSVVSGHTDKLMVNNIQIYPVGLGLKKLLTTLTADQYIKGPDNTWLYSSSPRLSYGLRVRQRRIPASSRKNRVALITFHLEIIEVANKFVRGIPGLEIKAFETKSGRLIIGDVHTSVTSQAITPAKDCTTLLCKWKAIIAAKTAALKKGCGKAKGYGAARLHGIQGGPDKYKHHSRPHGSFPHRHGRPQQSPFARIFRSITFHIIVPILIGIAVGITASIVGMIVGHIAIFFWRILFRRGERSQYCRVKQIEIPDNMEDETKGFLENQGPPPVYEVIIVEEKTEQK